jgi:hypothetical protein
MSRRVLLTREVFKNQQMKRLKLYRLRVLYKSASTKDDIAVMRLRRYFYDLIIIEQLKDLTKQKNAANSSNNL